MCKNSCGIFLFVTVVVTCALYYYHFKIFTATKFVSYVVNDSKFFETKKNLQFECMFVNEFSNNSYHGLVFSTRWNDILDELNLLNVKTLDDEKILTSTPVIGTAISSNHLGPYKEFLRTVENFYKNKTFVYLYDLGLK